MQTRSKSYKWENPEVRQRSKSEEKNSLMFKPPRHQRTNRTKRTWEYFPNFEPATKNVSWVTRITEVKKHNWCFYIVKFYRKLHIAGIYNNVAGWKSETNTTSETHLSYQAVRVETMWAGKEIERSNHQRVAAARTLVLTTHKRKPKKRNRLITINAVMIVTIFCIY